jgi:glycerol-3-phosphate acyltransferase PlsY
MLNYALVLIAYLLGSISSAVVVSKLMGLQDPRHAGSGNPGATNVLRLGGKKAAILTLVGDVLKGVIPVVVAQGLTDEPTVLAAVALAAFLGHLYPVFFGFKGGKGVATAFGVLVGLSPWVGIAVLLTWLIMAFAFRYSSLSAITAAVLAPLYAWIWLPHPAYIGTTFVMSLILLWRHRPNIRNLLSGAEGKIGQR